MFKLLRVQKLIIIFLILFFSVVTWTLVQKIELDKNPPGRIIFRAVIDLGDYSPHYFIMDPDGGHIVPLYLKYTGSPAWSGNGRWIALGCEDSSSICILDTKDIYNRFVYPQDKTGGAYYSFEPVRQIPLPEPCILIPEKSRNIRLSWSPENERLALTCNSFITEGLDKICVIRFPTESLCWDYQDQGVNSIENVDWSPHQDTLAISIAGKNGPQIMLAGVDGKNSKVLTDGWSAGWSPDGKQIAFMRFADGTLIRENDQLVLKDGLPLSGLAVVDASGQNFHWLIAPKSELYENGNKPTQLEELSKNIGFSDCDGTRCGLDWSPDGRYLIFSADYGAYGNFKRIMRYDLWTQEITIPFALSDHCEEPAWGNYP